MPQVNYMAIVVAGLAAFVVSFIWYAVFGNELGKVSAAFAQQKPAVWKMLVVVGQSLVIAFVLAYVIGLVGNTDWMTRVSIAVLLWLGLAAMQWVGSMLWEKVPFKMAAIHAGDWLVKLAVISFIVGV